MTETILSSRRNFLKASSIAGGGLIVGLSLNGCGGDEASPLPMDYKEGAFLPNAFIQVTSDNLFQFFCPRDEMGQGITTGLATLIAEELDVPPGKIKIEFARTHEAYVNPLFGQQITGGSTSMRAHYLPLRQAAANTRQALLNAAAKDLKLPAGRLKTSDGYIQADGKSYPYGRFVKTASQRIVPANAPLTPDSEFKYIGADIRRTDAVEKSTGTAIYGIDIDIPDMHHAVVKRSPVAGGKVKSFDHSSAIKMPGVITVAEIDTGVAVVAKKYWQAKQAAEKLKITWSSPALSKINTDQIKSDYQQALAEESGTVDQVRGDIEAGFASANKLVERQFWAPYLAHATLEPMNAVVRIQSDQVEVWTGTQAPIAVQGVVSRYSGMPKEKIRVYNTYLGGGFGRRTKVSHVIEATQAALAAKKPVQVLWSREDDIQNGFYRPASLMKIKAGIDAEGKITAWQAARVGANIDPDAFGELFLAMLPGSVPEALTALMTGGMGMFYRNWKVAHSSVEGLCENYDFPNREVRHITKNHGIPLIYWRSVGHSFTAFAKEALIDELAQGYDPADFRLKNTQNTPRLNQVIKLAGEKMRQMKPAPGRALGLAAHASFGSYVAEVAEVSVHKGRIRVHKVLCVVDCGKAVNPDIVKAQMEGSVMFGLTAALHGDLELENGVIKQSNFHDYPILRINEAPSVEVIIMDSQHPPSGVGEPGLPPIAPAVANAVFSLTGQRLYSLPLKLA